MTAAEKVTLTCHRCEKRFEAWIDITPWPINTDGAHCKECHDELSFGPQEPPDDPRIFNRKQADGSYRPLAEFFNGDDRDR
jgi:hypothetical protein